MKIRIAATLTVAASLFVAAANSHAAEVRVPPKTSFLLEVSGVKEIDKIVDERAVALMEFADKIGIGEKSMTPDELGFLLEVSGIRVNTVKAPEELGFLLEISGLRSRSLTINDVRGLVIAYGLGVKMSDPDLEFTCTDDLANILMLTSQSEVSIPPSQWIIILGDATGILMN